jgi:hypothetical protein
MTTAPISDPLTLRRPRDGRATRGNPDDYDVLSGDRANRPHLSQQQRAARSSLDVDDHRRGGYASRAVTRLRADAGRGQDDVRDALAEMACASIVRLMRVSAPRQTRSDACVIDGREPGWFLQGKPPGIWLGLDPEHFGTVLGRKEGGAATTGEGRRRHRPIPHGCDGHAGYSVHGHVTGCSTPGGR